MSDIVLHYIADHGWLPLPNVITAVMKYNYLGGRRGSASTPELIGYQTYGAIGHATGGFRQKLEMIFSEAILNGDWQPNL
jgi:hypothetical protein